MKEKIDTTSIINTLIESSQKHHVATKNGDYKEGNDNYDLIVKAVNFLIENDSLEDLKKLLLHEEVGVRLMAASFLLKYYEKESTAVLEDIISSSIPHLSFGAEMVLQEWKKGTLNL